MSERDEEGSWKDVPGRKTRRGRGNKGASNFKGPVTKFYVTHLPPGCIPWEVSEFVRVFGDVTGVYIARKKDKEGRKFGFISFRNVVDVKEMEHALNGTKMGGYKLMANLAKFAVENEGLYSEVLAEGKGKSKVFDSQPQVHNFTNQAFVNNRGGKLFKDLFSVSNVGVGDSSNPKKNDEGIGSFISIPEDTLAFKDLLGKALVGRCRDITTLRSLNALLAECDIQGVSLSYIGGLSMLIKFLNESVCSEFLLNYSVWEPWFSSLDIWNGQSLPFERLAWVRVQGVPIHLASTIRFSI
ncbi:putative RNA recognition motif domain, nucleotide-binding alpha-beta plait domain superfamily [Helianthus annuus]|nr:putative RNA recognition motif domain, nucleotide-binding alpha-beta plait domain superfamily [Helianthus annuus]KAJ0541001.1 putative RNA recognition motif domain, nucleotide-binding alpha-beta plait domain superfamily [Helianthus annuus]KAJ0710210.1 putative RNA recognition motif domain, nucleotide-binding alpha-beta plait domain superfamily [Helianthus annuus]KAJ0886534.1 putative RNA recognition motif domain, nucleotide-binding alpha-beta plait domain superfamily [Helianthus annuus]